MLAIVLSLASAVSFNVDKTISRTYLAFSIVNVSSNFSSSSGLVFSLLLITSIQFNALT